MSVIWRIAASVSILFVAAAAAAQSTPFYRGKQLEFIIRAEPGGSYDLYMRTLAKYMVNYVPGTPLAVPVNMPGGGGLVSLSYFDKVAPHDGTALNMVTQTEPLEQALGTNPNLKTDLTRLNWIGNMSEQNTFLVVRANSPTRTLSDATKRVTLLAASGSSGSDYILANVLNAVFHTKFKSIIGYRSSPEMDMAIRRGEAEGRFTTSLAGLFSSTPGGAKEYRLVVQIGDKPDPQYPNVPLLKNLPSDRPGALDLISDVMSFGRPVATNSGVPPDRVAILRAAFDQTMRDAGFLKENERQQLDISPWSGQQAEKVVARIIDVDPKTKTFLRRAVTGR